MKPPTRLALNLLALGGAVGLVASGGLDLSLSGAKEVIAIIFPALLLAELGYLAVTHWRSRNALSLAFKLPLLIYLVHALLAAHLYVDMAWVQPHFAQYAPFQLSMNVAGFLLGYVIWEFAHYVHHWSCHKVRLFWCLHAPHHAPEHLNLAVTHVNFLYQGLHSTLIRFGICTALGVPLPMLLLIFAIDSCWGGLVHVSEEAWRSGRLPGVLGRYFLSPIHHRIHHASNPEYIDKNYCHLLPLWDKVFGTFQDEVQGIRPRYGLARPIKTGSFFDLYFGEFRLLAKDIASACSFSDAALYLVMPPGWEPKSKRQNLRSAASAD